MYNIDSFKQKLKNCSSTAQLYETIVNTPFSDKLQMTKFGLGIVVLLIQDKAAGVIDRVALSDTEHAHGAVNISVKKFKDIVVPISAEDNVIVQTITRDQFSVINDWKHLFVPALTAQEARFNQAGAGIDCSVVYPLSKFPQGGAMIFSYYEPISKITDKHHEFMRAYAEACAEALSNAPK